MTKFHINKHGVPAPCKAKKGNCPLGGSDGTENHFDTIEEAQAQADAQFAEEYGTAAVYDWDGDYDLPAPARAELNKIYKMIDEKADEVYSDYTIPEVSFHRMDDRLNSYAEELIKRDYFGDKEFDSDDYDNLKYEMAEVWTQEVDDYEIDWDYQEEIKEKMYMEAEETEGAFFNKAEAIDEVYQEAKKVDWEAVGVSRKEGMERAFLNAGVLE